MLGSRRTPLAWRQLVHDKKKFLLSLMGIAFAVFLMFIEMGFLFGVYDSQTLLVNSFDADLVMVNSLRDLFNAPTPFSRQRLLQAQNFESVSAVAPVYLGRSNQWKSLDGRLDPVSVLGIDPERPFLNIADQSELAEALKEPDTVLADRLARDLIQGLEPGSSGELNGRRVRVTGSFSLGPDFVVDAWLITSDRNFVNYFPNPATNQPDPDRIEYGLIKLKPGADPVQAASVLEDSLSLERTWPLHLNGPYEEAGGSSADPGHGKGHLPRRDIEILTPAALAKEIESYWSKFQPIGQIFGLGMAVGFVIGVTICYQILFTDVNDHMSEYATLKAIGHSDSSLVRVVVEEAMYLSLLGFVPGLILSLLTFSYLERMTGIVMKLDFSRAGMVLAMTVVMCLISALFALRKVIQADPAEVF